MDELADYDGSGLELVHLSDVLDYLGRIAIVKTPI